MAVPNLPLDNNICKMMAFDGFNGTHCYRDASAEWSSGPPSFGSFQELYDYVDQDKRDRLMEIIRHYQEQQEDTSQYMYGWYTWIFVFFFLVQVASILWQLAEHGWDRRHSNRSRPWPWCYFTGITSLTNELLFRVILLLGMALMNAALWPVTGPILLYVLGFGILARVSQRVEEETDEEEDEDSSSEEN